MKAQLKDIFPRSRLQNKIPSSLLDAPLPIDLIGLPTGNFWVHEFPTDIPAAETLHLVLNDVKKKLLDFSSQKLLPVKQRKQPEKKIRHTEIALRFPQKIKAMKIFLDMKSRMSL